MNKPEVDWVSISRVKGNKKNNVLQAWSLFIGVCHGEDISVFFNHTVGDMKPSDADEEEFVAKLTKMWATFAKTGFVFYVTQF